MRKALIPLLTHALYAKASLAHEEAHNDSLNLEQPNTANHDKAKEKKVEYGTYIVPPRSEDNGMLRFKDEVDPPCSNCAITVMSADLEYPNGTVADAETGMWLHHIVFINKANVDSVCGDSKPGQRFFGTGNDRSPLDLTNGGKSKTAYQIPPNTRFQISVELMNLRPNPQTVTLSATWSYLSSPDYQAANYALATPYWLDIAGCGHSDRPAAADSRFAYSSPRLRAAMHGRIAYLGNHLHDGAIRAEVMKNGRVICSVEPSYSTPSGNERNSHLTLVPSCFPISSSSSSPPPISTSNTSITPGDEFLLTASYDTTIHAPMLTADGSLEPVMGVALAYIVEGEEAAASVRGMRGFGVAIALVVLIVAVIPVGAAYALYVRKGRHYREWLPGWLPSRRKQRYHSLRRREEEEEEEGEVESTN